MKTFTSALRAPAESITPTNTSGIAPLDLRVLVRPDPVEERVGSIIMPDSVKDQHKWAQAKGTLVAAGENAWEEAAARSSKFRRPQPGDRVLYGKYSGVEVKGDDGADYRLMNDEDVLGLLTETA